MRSSRACTPPVCVRATPGRAGVERWLGLHGSVGAGRVPGRARRGAGALRGWKHGEAAGQVGGGRSAADRYGVGNHVWQVQAAARGVAILHGAHRAPVLYWPHWSLHTPGALAPRAAPQCAQREPSAAAPEIDAPGRPRPGGARTFSSGRETFHSCARPSTRRRSTIVTRCPRSCSASARNSPSVPPHTATSQSSSAGSRRCRTRTTGGARFSGAERSACAAECSAVRARQAGACDGRVAGCAPL